MIVLIRLAQRYIARRFLQSLLFVAGLLPGTWVGTRLLTRFVIR
mgnify:CR=1 FL=1